MTSQFICASAKEFFSSACSKCSCNECDNYVEYKLSIPIVSKVCGFDVESFLIIEKIQNNSNKNCPNENKPNIDKSTSWKYSFEVLSDKIESMSGDKHKFLLFTKLYGGLSVKNTQLFLKLTNQMLLDVKFNKSSGLFETSNTLAHDIFNDNFIEIGECCVCYDKTSTKTSCSHFVCVECLTNLKKKECPYCRNTSVKINK